MNIITVASENDIQLAVIALTHNQECDGVEFFRPLRIIGKPLFSTFMGLQCFVDRVLHRICQRCDSLDPIYGRSKLAQSRPAQLVKFTTRLVAPPEIVQTLTLYSRLIFNSQDALLHIGCKQAVATTFVEIMATRLTEGS